MEITETTAVIGLGIQILVAVVTVVWTAGKVARGLRLESETRQQQYADKVDTELESLRKSVGEMGAAIRLKITDVEFYVRDNYVTNSMMEKIFGMFGETMKLQFDSLKEGIETIKLRLDQENKS